MVTYIAVLQLFLAAQAIAQAKFASPAWEYSGCINIGAIAFDHTAKFVDSFTPQQCQSACNGYGFAAAFVELCLCGNGIEDITSLKLEDSACNIPCGGDVNLGFCGHMDADSSYANVYAVCSDSSTLGLPTTTPAILSIELPSVTFPSVTIKLPPSTPCDTTTTTQTTPTVSICSEEPDIPGLVSTETLYPSYVLPPVITESAFGLGPVSSSSALPPGNYESYSLTPPCPSDSVPGTTFVVAVSSASSITSSAYNGNPPLPYSTSISQPSPVGYSDPPGESPATELLPPPSYPEDTQSVASTLTQTSTVTSAIVASATSGDSIPPGEATATTSEPAVVTGGGSHISYNTWAIMLATGVTAFFW